MITFALFGVVFFIFAIIMFIVNILISVWVYRDAQRRYKNSDTPILWLLIVLLTGLIGLIVYLIVRPSERSSTI